MQAVEVSHLHMFTLTEMHTSHMHAFVAQNNINNSRKGEYLTLNRPVQNERVDLLEYFHIPSGVNTRLV